MKKIFKLFKIKKIFFFPPKKTDIIIFDRTNSHIFKPYIKNTKYDICDTKLESLNIFILVVAVYKYKFKFNFFYYLIEYLKYTNCKTIITFIDNNINFYKIKNYIKNIRTISIQNGLRTEFFFNDLKNEKNLKIDFFFGFNNFYISEYQKNIEGNFINSGSFKSNEISILKKKNNDLVYISSGPENFENSMKVYKDIKIETNKYFYPEKILMKTIEKFCDFNNLNLKILGRARDDDSEKCELDFYQNLLKKRLDKNYYSFKNKYQSSYEVCDQSKICVCIYSALGLEILSRYCKTVIFNFRSEATQLENLNIFSPMRVRNNGEFWSSEMDQNKILEKLTYVNNLREDQWRNTLNNFKLINLLGRDEGNKNFIKLLNEKN
jgi:surface carbohydrate biosynthesis protein